MACNFGGTAGYEGEWGFLCSVKKRYYNQEALADYSDLLILIIHFCNSYLMLFLVN